jgi:hypothetical protein
MLDHLREVATLTEALGNQQRLGEVSPHMTQYFWAICDHDRAIESGQRARAKLPAALELYRADVSPVPESP